MGLEKARLSLGEAMGDELCSSCVIEAAAEKASKGQLEVIVAARRDWDEGVEGVKFRRSLSNCIG